MEILNVSKQSLRKKDINKIASVLSSGDLVVLPTETVYTFAVDATQEKAVKNVFKIKNRRHDKPIHVVVSSLKMAKRYVEVNKYSKLLAGKFLPGPLTLILKKKNSSSLSILTAGLSTLGIRIPDLSLNLLVSKSLDKPYTTTSANVAGNPNPYTVEDCLNQLSAKKTKMISLVVNIGRLPQIKPSTLLDLTVDPPKILRKGPVTEKTIQKVLNI